ncbi:hypothetical protein MANY_11150 [Mycolicibacterium anyangense]|uniref:Uncharacterized protein n=1 Tax=Mycolicibacterium anyangense TaxID=1431246 RepID=A0A6N4W5H5_9MYCO|nr:hypothetical protein MANY_11150 [Mycolicibacterium anyangense]
MRSSPVPDLRHGDDDALVRERRGTTPLTHEGSLIAGCDGPARSGLLSPVHGRFFRRLPGDGRIGADGGILAADRSDL